MYKTNQGETRVEVLFNGQTFWLTQKRMADLYGVDVRTVSYHLGEIYDSGELKENATIRKIGIVQTEGEREERIRGTGFWMNSGNSLQKPVPLIPTLNKSGK
jgi:hypothetical protein